MTTKADLVSKILAELRKARTEKWVRPATGPIKMIPIPPMLSLGDGRSLKATEELLSAVSAYARIYWENDPSLRPRFKRAELTKLIEQCFGQALAEIDLTLNDDQLKIVVKNHVTELVGEQIQRYDRPTDLILGCHLIEGETPYPIRIGSVLFETRDRWCQRMLATKKLSPITARRLQAHWSGKPIRKRKGSFDSTAERSILDAIGPCPIVCQVTTDGLSGKYVQEKGLLAARLAISAISLTWLQPSEGLKWMNLLYDRHISHRHTALFWGGKNIGFNSARTQLPSGRYIDDELLDSISYFRWLFDQFGEVIDSYVQPKRPILRPNMMNTLFLSLWWYHEACREPLDQIATTKFAASMDALTGGRKAKGIEQLINARLGPKPEDQLMSDGRTTKAVIAQIYDGGRSRLLHGSSDDFAHDWTQTRESAEMIGRLLLVSCCQWVLDNPKNDNVSDLSQRGQ